MSHTAQVADDGSAPCWPPYKRRAGRGGTSVRPPDATLEHHGVYLAEHPADLRRGPGRAGLRPLRGQRRRPAARHLPLPQRHQRRRRRQRPERHHRQHHLAGQAAAAGDRLQGELVDDDPRRGRGLPQKERGGLQDLVHQDPGPAPGRQERRGEGEGGRRQLQPRPAALPLAAQPRPQLPRAGLRPLRQ
ncbi:hypothetical protein FOCC_FOCC006982 [Frankliniella occidentalis]|nr:hypothetical protein FOCC_FOCC006982 [Frankliniella occidentalis]